MKKLFFLLFLFLLAGNLNSQVIQLWESRFDGPYHVSDGVGGLSVDSAGNVYVVGSTFYPPTLAGHTVIIKYDINGDSLWQKFIPFTGGVDIKRYGSNNFIILMAISTHEYTISKMNSNGDFLWSATEIIDAKDFKVDSEGNTYLCGKNFNTGENRLIKYSETGSRVVDKIINYSLVHLDFDADRYIYTTGFSGVDLALSKYTPAGDTIWTKKLNRSDTLTITAISEGLDIAVDSSKNVFVGGEARVQPADQDYIIAKYDSNGNYQWHRLYEPMSTLSDQLAGRVIEEEDSELDYFEICRVMVDYQGNIIFVGASNSQIGYTFMKYSSSGNILWSKQHQWRKAALDEMGNIFVGGDTNGITGFDYSLAKYNPDGNLDWTARYWGPKGQGEDRLRSMYLDKDNQIYVTGTSRGIGTIFDIATVKYYYDPVTTGISNIPGSVPSAYTLYNNFPNPFNPSTTIRFDVPVAGLIKLKIYDMLGKEITELVNNELEAGTYDYNWNAGANPSGVYFYKLEGENFSQTKKMILIK